MGGEIMKILYILIYSLFLVLSVYNGHDLSRVKQKTDVSCDTKRQTVHTIPKIEVAAHISNDTIYSEFMNQSLDTVIIRLCTNVLEGSKVSFYRTESEGEEPIIQQELFTLPFTNFLFLHPSGNRIFPIKMNGKYLQEANYAKYELYYFLPSIRRGGRIVKWSHIQKPEANVQTVC